MSPERGYHQCHIYYHSKLDRSVKEKMVEKNFYLISNRVLRRNLKNSYALSSSCLKHILMNRFILPSLIEFLSSFKNLCCRDGLDDR